MFFAGYSSFFRHFELFSRDLDTKGQKSDRNQNSISYLILWNISTLVAFNDRGHDTMRCNRPNRKKCPIPSFQNANAIVNCNNTIDSSFITAAFYSDLPIPQTRISLEMFGKRTTVLRNHKCALILIKAKL